MQTTKGHLVLFKKVVFSIVEIQTRNRLDQVLCDVVINVLIVFVHSVDGHTHAGDVQEVHKPVGHGHGVELNHVKGQVQKVPHEFEAKHHFIEL